MRVKLVIVGENAKAAEIKVRLPTIIGRGRNAKLRLPHPLVSRKHCELYEENGQVMARDLGSLNGTFVANERISEAELPSGELLTIGTVTFRVVYGEDGIDAEDTASHDAARREDEEPSTLGKATESPQEDSGSQGPTISKPVQDTPPPVIDRETTGLPSRSPTDSHPEDGEDLSSFLRDLP